MRVVSPRFSALMLVAENTGENSPHLTGVFCDPKNTDDGALFLKTIKGPAIRLDQVNHPDIASWTGMIRSKGGFIARSEEAEKLINKNPVFEGLVRLAQKNCYKGRFPSFAQMPWIKAIPLTDGSRFKTIFDYPNQPPAGATAQNPEGLECGRILGLMASALIYNLKKGVRQTNFINGVRQPIRIDVNHQIFNSTPVEVGPHWRVYPHNMGLVPEQMRKDYEKKIAESPAPEVVS